MENLKIRVETEAESKEAQELFFELGAKWISQINREEDAYVMSTEYPSIILYGGDMDLNYWNTIEQFNSDSRCKEITIQQLKDMVILKRNDPKDATHSCDGASGLGLFLDGKWYAYNYNVGEWEVWTDCFEFKLKNLKPITKEKTFKEYLQKLDYGSYKLVKLDNVVDGHDGLIEVPEGALRLTKGGFFKDEHTWWSHTKKEWLNCEDGWSGFNKILWQRHIQPEELPFIDDEPITYKNGGAVDWLSEAKKQSSVETETGKHLDITSAFIGYKCRRQGESDDSYRKRLLDFGYSRSKTPLQPKTDNVNHPSHYTNGKVECIDALESATVGKSGIEAVCTANIIKYLWRYEDKNGLEDVEKAQWYLNKLVDVLKNK